MRRFDENSAVTSTVIVGTLLGLAVSRFVVKYNNYADFEQQGMLIGGAAGLVVSIIAAVCLWKKFKKTQDEPKQKMLIATAVILFVLLAASALLLVECQRM